MPFETGSIKPERRVRRDRGIHRAATALQNLDPDLRRQRHTGAHHSMPRQHFGARGKRLAGDPIDLAVSESGAEENRREKKNPDTHSRNYDPKPAAQYLRRAESATLSRHSCQRRTTAMHRPADNAHPGTHLPGGGVGNMLLATLAFATMNVFVKQLDRIPAMEIVFFRCLVSGIICAVEIARRQLDWKGNNHTLLIARGTFGTLALFAFFVTLQHMNLATAVTIQYLSPIFTALIGVFVLRESVPARQWFFYAVAFAGVFVLKGFDSRVSLFYLLIGIASALCSGMAYNLVRRLREREDPIVVVFHFQLVGIAAGLVFICSAGARLRLGNGFPSSCAAF